MYYSEQWEKKNQWHTNDKDSSERRGQRGREKEGRGGEIRVDTGDEAGERGERQEKEGRGRRKREEGGGRGKTEEEEGRGRRKKGEGGERRVDTEDEQAHHFSCTGHILDRKLYLVKTCGELVYFIIAIKDPFLHLVISYPHLVERITSPFYSVVFICLQLPKTMKLSIKPSHGG